MPRLDSTAAWAAARRMVAANRDMLVAIGGVFFLLPGLIGVLVLPALPLTRDMDQQAMADAVMKFYASAGPILILLALPTLVGYLTLLVILLDRDRPPVGRAIVQAVRLLPGYLVVQVATAMALSFAWVTLIGLLALVLPAVVAMVVSIVVMLYPLTRIMLIGPEMAAFRLRNPLRAIQAGLARTRGQVVALLLFFGPAMALFAVVYMLAMMAVGSVIALAWPASSPDQAIAGAQRMIAEAIGGTLFAVGYTYFCAMAAATWRQLGPIQGSDPDSPFAI